MFKRPFIYIAIVTFVVAVTMFASAISVLNNETYVTVNEMYEEYEANHRAAERESSIGGDVGAYASLAAQSYERAMEQAEEIMAEYEFEAIVYSVVGVMFLGAAILFLVLAIKKKPRPDAPVNPVVTPYGQA